LKANTEQVQVVAHVNRNTRLEKWHLQWPKTRSNTKCKTLDTRNTQLGKQIRKRYTRELQKY